MKAASLHFSKKNILPAAILSVLIFLAAAIPATFSQAPAELSLADILIGLRSKKVELPDRNKILTEAILARGITFSLTPEIEKELEATGADKALVDAIRKKSMIVKTSAVVTPANDQKPASTVSTPPAPVQDFAFFMKRAEASAEKHDLDAALVDFGKAIELKPDSFEAFLERGLAHLNKKALELAISDLSKAVDLNPKSAIAFSNRGDAFEKKGDAAKAKADYQKAVELDANVEPAKTNLGKMIAEEQRIQREAEEARKAEEAKKLEELKKIAPAFVDLGQINLSLATRMATPTYPSAALRAGISGMVKVEVNIDEEGNVTDAKAVDGHQFLRMAAEDAARRSKFKPAMYDGKPIKSKGYIVYNFSPNNK
jgi:TonB family protein